jgi:rhodanese-related sulfurtransferase
MLRRFVKRVVGKLRGSAVRVTTPPPPPPPPTPEPIAEAETLASINADVQEVRERVEAGEPVTLLDVRTDNEVAAGKIPGAKHIPLDQLEARWEELENCNEVVCYCAAGMRSLRAAELLRGKGLFNATSLDGGIALWKDQGGPIEGSAT